MSDIEHAIATPSDQDLLVAVDARVDTLLQHGAKLLDPSFSVASAGQAEVVFDRVRLLVTPNGSAYQRYVEVMTASNAPFIANNSRFGDEQVVVGEIPRYARVVPQIVRSRYPDTGATPITIFERFGSQLGRLAALQGVVPDAGKFSLRHNILVLRDSLDVMLVPPVAFVEATDKSRHDLTTSIEAGLLPMKPRFGIDALMRVFRREFEDGRS